MSYRARAAAVRQALGDGPALARCRDGTSAMVLRAFVVLLGTDPCR